MVLYCLFWFILMSNAPCAIEFDTAVLEARKMGKHKDLSMSDKVQIVIARWMGQIISRTVAIWAFSQSAGVSIYQKWSKKGTVVNQWQCHGWPRLIDAGGSEGWPVWSDPTDKLLLLKLLKNLMLVLTERCQNTQCITVHCIWDLFQCATKQKLFMMVWGAHQQVWCVDLASKFPRSPIEMWDVVDKQVWSIEAPPRNLQDLKDLL